MAGARSGVIVDTRANSKNIRAQTCMVASATEDKTERHVSFMSTALEMRAASAGETSNIFLSRLTLMMALSGLTASEE